MIRPVPLQEFQSHFKPKMTHLTRAIKRRVQVLIVLSDSDDLAPALHENVVPPFPLERTRRHFPCDACRPHSPPPTDVVLSRQGEIQG